MLPIKQKAVVKRLFVLLAQKKNKLDGRRKGFLSTISGFYG